MSIVIGGTECSPLNNAGSTDLENACMILSDATESISSAQLKSSPVSEDHCYSQPLCCDLQEGDIILSDFRSKHQLHSDMGSVNGDRILEQFSEVLLRDDSESDLESSARQADSVLAVDEEKVKVEKRVRFADEDSDQPAKMQQPDDGGGGDETFDVSDHSFHTVQELVSGVEYSAEYLGSTPILHSDVAKTTRMCQAEAAVSLVKDSDDKCQPRIPVSIKISITSIKIADSKTKVDLMEHALQTISFVADVHNTLVIMVHRASSTTAVQKLTCHVLDASNVRHLTLVIGEAFTAAYRNFLRQNGIKEEDIEEAEYHNVLNAQSVSALEVDSFMDESKLKQIVFHKNPGELLGIVVMESGYGSAIPTCVVAHIDKMGAAAKSGLLNVGDHIISINGVSLVGMPLKTSIQQIKRCKTLNLVRMAICSCSAVVDVRILRPSIKFQLGFSVQDGIICSLRRGTIAERSGIRIGHRIIEINGTSTVDMDHGHIVDLLTTVVGDLHIRTMPQLMYQLLTGQINPEYL